MNHWRARGLVAALPDATLPAVKEKRVRAHLARCARCREKLRELEASEALLRRLPLALLPLEKSLAAEARLAAFARWSGPRRPAAPGIQPRRAAVARGVAALAAAAAVALALVGGEQPDPPATEPFNFVLASARLESRSVARARPQPAMVRAVADHTSLDLYLLPVGLR